MTDLVLITSSDYKGSIHYLMPASVVAAVDQFVQETFPTPAPRVNLGSSRPKPVLVKPKLVSCPDDLVNNMRLCPAFIMDDDMTPDMIEPLEPFWASDKSLFDSTIIGLIGDTLKIFDGARDALTCAQENGAKVVGERAIRSDGF